MSTLQEKYAQFAGNEPELLNGVLAYENEDVVVRIMKVQNCDRSKAEAIFKDTLRFLYICGTTDGGWGPTQVIDAGWHEFLMFTRDYADFCQKYFGRFIHHNPNRPDSTADRDRPRRTLIAAMQLFGKENLSENWVYRNASGHPVLGPDIPIEKMQEVEMAGPCDSCGCDAACSDD